MYEMVVLLLAARWIAAFTVRSVVFVLCWVVWRCSSDIVLLTLSMWTSLEYLGANLYPLFRRRPVEGF